MDLNRQLIDLENERIALQKCELILKQIIESEKEDTDFGRKKTYITAGWEIEKPILCIMIVHLQKIFIHNCIIVETVEKEQKKITYISISIE